MDKQTRFEHVSLTKSILLFPEFWYFSIFQKTEILNIVVIFQGVNNISN